MPSFSGFFHTLTTLSNFLAKAVVPIVQKEVPSSIPFTNIFLQFNDAIQKAESILPASGTGAAKSIIAMTILEQAAPAIISETEKLTGKPMVDQAAFEDFVKLQTDAMVALFKAHGVVTTGVVTGGSIPTKAG